MSTFDTWGGSWGTSWATSWTRTASSGPTLLGGKAYGYRTPYSQHEEEEYQRKKLENTHAELQRLDNEIALSEREQREAREKLAQASEQKRQKKAAKELVALEASLQEEINRLRMERVWLIRRIDDEEAILLLLLSLPFH